MSDPLAYWAHVMLDIESKAKVEYEQEKIHRRHMKPTVHDYDPQTRICFDCGKSDQEVHSTMFGAYKPCEALAEGP